jgi:hypothetical protein
MSERNQLRDIFARPLDTVRELADLALGRNDRLMQSLDEAEAQRAAAIARTEEVIARITAQIDPVQE